MHKCSKGANKGMGLIKIVKFYSIASVNVPCTTSLSTLVTHVLRM